MQRDLDGPYSIGSDDYRSLTDAISLVFGDHGPRSVLELGSGESTFQLAADYPDAHIYSLENHPAILEENVRELERLKVDHAKIVHAPITCQFIGWGVYRTYDLRELPPGVEFDVVVVDGPVERLYPLGREAALYLLFGRVAVGGIIGLDDYHRPSAKTAVRRWRSAYGASLEEFHSTDTFMILKKTRVFAGGKPIRLSHAAASLRAISGSVLREIRRRVSLALHPHGS